MTFRWHSIGLALALAVSPAVAYTNGWQGWPCPTNQSWYSAAETNHYFYQLWTGLLERCVAVGVAAPVCVDSHTVYDGFTNNVVTTNGLTVTNQVIQYRTIVTTNQYLPFGYTYSNDFTNGTGTVYPPMRRSWFTAWDSTLFSIVGSYVDTRLIGADGTYNDYFASVTASLSSASAPVYSRASLFGAAGIGYTNAGHWTASTSGTNADWLLASIHSGTNTGWTFNEWSPLDSVHPGTLLEAPMAQFVAGGTCTPSAVNAITVTVSGLSWTGGVGYASALDTAVITSSVPSKLSSMWRTVTNITVSTRLNSNDAIRIVYDATSMLYYEDMGWRLTPQSLIERQACINLLTNSYVQHYDRSSWYSLDGQRYGDEGDGNWSTAKALADYWYHVQPAYPFLNPYIFAGRKGDKVIASSTRYAFQQSMMRIQITNIPHSAQFSYLADYYLYSEPCSARDGTMTSTNCFDALGTPLLPFQYVKVGSNVTAKTGNSCMESALAGTISSNKPAVWPADPSTGITNGGAYLTTAVGFNVKPRRQHPGSLREEGKAIIIYQWTVTNGFKYK